MAGYLNSIRALLLLSLIQESWNVMVIVTDKKCHNVYMWLSKMGDVINRLIYNNKLFLFKHLPYII